MLRQALRGLLAQHQADGMLPTSGRFLFYELVTAAHKCNRDGSMSGPRSATRNGVLCAIFATIIGP